MKLEFIPDGSTDAPLVRLFDFDANEASRLSEVFAKLAASSVQSCAYGLNHADFIESVRGCRLILSVGNRDSGVVNILGLPSIFGCSLTPETWDTIRELTQPFTKPGKIGFQWLDRTNIPLLLSFDGQW